MSCWRYEFIIDSCRLLRKVPLPKRMARGVKEMWTKHGRVNPRIKPGVLYFQRGHQDKIMAVSVEDRTRSTGELETALCDGWRKFARSINLQLGDRLRLSLQVVDVLLYQVRIWRGDEEITGVGADSSFYTITPVEMREPDPSFHIMFTRGYFEKPTINIPLEFARKYFHGVEDQSPVVLLLENRTWDLTMRVVYKKCKNTSNNSNIGASSSTSNRYNNKIITKCEIKQGMRELANAVQLEEGEKAVVELAAMDPIYMAMYFS